MTRLVSLLVLCLFGNIATGQEETCAGEDEGYSCQKSEECPWFEEMKAYMANMTKGSDERNEVVEDLRSVVCDKKEQKVCCPLEYEPEESTTVEEDDSLVSVRSHGYRRRGYRYRPSYSYSCKNVYETVWSTKHVQKYENVCETVYVEKCKTEHRKECHPIVRQECGTYNYEYTCKDVYDEECSHHPVNECHKVPQQKCRKEYKSVPTRVSKVVAKKVCGKRGWH